MQEKPNPPTDIKKRRGWVVYQLKMSGRSMAGVARKHGLKRVSFYSVFGRRWYSVEKILADELGLQLSELWAERYDEHNHPKKWDYRRPARRLKSVDKVRLSDIRGTGKRKVRAGSESAALN